MDARDTSPQDPRPIPAPDAAAPGRRGLWAGFAVFGVAMALVAWWLDARLTAELVEGPQGDSVLPVAGGASSVHLWVLAGLALLVLAGALLTRLVQRHWVAPLAALDAGLAALARGERPAPSPPGPHAAVLERVDALQRRLADCEQQLAVEAAEKRAILGALEAGLLAIDAEGRVSRANLPARTLLGLSGDPVGRRLTEITRVSGLLNAVSESREKAAPVTVECQVPGLEEMRVLQVAVSPVSATSQACVAVLRDLSERRRLEHVRQDFVANVSHELKTPLTTMRSYLETVLDDPDMPAGVRENFLDKVQRSTNRLASIVSDLLDLTRIESSRPGGERHPVDLYALAAECIGLAQSSAESRSVMLRLAGAEGPWVVHGEDNALQLAIQNLIDNAIKYSPEGGVVTVSLEGDDEALVLAVKDQGPGIPEAERERIFERFYRIDKDRSRALGGTGLGLSIVKNAVLSHGGHVDVVSGMGQGSTFRVRLPRAPSVD